jgi:hypothetical protein
MQTKLICFGAALTGVASYFAYLNYPYILTGIMFIGGIGTTILAITKKDKKDEQIEEIHSKITNNKNKPTKTSTKIIKPYMESARKLDADAYKNDIVALNRNLASRGIYSSGFAVMQVKDLKLSHIKSFVENCLEYVASTQSNYSLDKPSVKSLFENYQTDDITEFTNIINTQYIARGLNIRQDIMPSIISEINNTYSIVLLRIDAM